MTALSLPTNIHDVTRVTLRDLTHRQQPDRRTAVETPGELSAFGSHI